jgi:hypothetical protein
LLETIAAGWLKLIDISTAPMVKEHHILIILSVDAEESKETRSIRHATFLGLPSKSAVWQRTLSTNQRPENTYSKKAALEEKTCC